VVPGGLSRRREPRAHSLPAEVIRVCAFSCGLSPVAHASRPALLPPTLDPCPRQHEGYLWSYVRTAYAHENGSVLLDVVEPRVADVPVVLTYLRPVYKPTTITPKDNVTTGAITTAGERGPTSRATSEWAIWGGGRWGLINRGT
jgi:hypothetical protein